jgi:hypothetical protein
MKIKLQNVRLSFPHLFQPQQQDSGASTYNAAFLIPKGHKLVDEINAAIVEVAKQKWGAKADAVLKQLRAADKLALHDGDTKSQYGGYEDHMFVNASNATRPLVLDRDKTPLTEADGRPYSGCYVNATIEIWAQDNKFGKRVNAGLGGVQFAKDGDRFAGGTQGDESDFDELEDGTDADDLV